MSQVPGSLDVDRQPPMGVPLQHFVTGLGFLLFGSVLGLARIGARPSLAHVHALLLGWVCLTILGAMTQFVPVWSGVTLHSERLAALQLRLVAVGLLGFLGALLAGATWALPIAGGVVVLGFWIFAYNIGRTLATVDSPGVTERHFGLALGFFVLVTSLGFLLAADFSVRLFPIRGITRTEVVATHATLAVFGAVLTTVFGALYQLATMFTQTDLHGVDLPLRRFEEITYPPGVVLLAAGRLFDAAVLARIGGVLVALGVLTVGAILARRLAETSVDRNPMLVRYAAAVPAMGLWAVLTLPVWIRDPLRPDALFGAPGTTHLLVFGVLGFVVLGTLYHIVPFIVWVHRYSDQLGYEKVPLVDDLYDARVATLDFAGVLGGGGLLVLSELVALPPLIRALGGALATVGFGLFAANMLLVVRRHSPRSLWGSIRPVDAEAGADDVTETADEESGSLTR